MTRNVAELTSRRTCCYISGPLGCLLVWYVRALHLLHRWWSRFPCELSLAHLSISQLIRCYTEVVWDSISTIYTLRRLLLCIYMCSASRYTLSWYSSLVHMMHRRTKLLLWPHSMRFHLMVHWWMLVVMAHHVIERSVRLLLLRCWLYIRVSSLKVPVCGRSSCYWLILVVVQMRSCHLLVMYTCLSVACKCLLLNEVVVVVCGSRSLEMLPSTKLKLICVLAITDDWCLIQMLDVGWWLLHLGSSRSLKLVLIMTWSAVCVSTSSTCELNVVVPRTSCRLLLLATFCHCCASLLLLLVRFSGRKRFCQYFATWRSLARIFFHL